MFHATAAMWNRRCEGLTIRFQQKELDDREDWEQVEFGRTVDYAWEEPLLSHRLRIGIESDILTYNVLHEYNLDVIKVCTPAPMCQGCSISYLCTAAFISNA